MTIANNPSSTGRAIHNGEMVVVVPPRTPLDSVDDISLILSENTALREELSVIRALLAHFLRRAPGMQVEIPSRELVDAWDGPDPVARRTDDGFLVRVPFAGEARGTPFAAELRQP